MEGRVCVRVCGRKEEANMMRTRAGKEGIGKVHPWPWGEDLALLEFIKICV